MATTSRSHLTDSPQLHDLARRLRAWRATPRRGQRIPEDLWRAATRLARTHGVSAISSALKLGYYELQRRLRASSAPTGSRRATFTAPHFIHRKWGQFLILVSSPPLDPDRGNKALPTKVFAQVNG